MGGDAKARDESLRLVFNPAIEVERAPRAHVIVEGGAEGPDSDPAASTASPGQMRVRASASSTAPASATAAMTVARYPKMLSLNSQIHGR